MLVHRGLQYAIEQRDNNKSSNEAVYLWTPPLSASIFGC